MGSRRDWGLLQATPLGDIAEERRHVKMGEYGVWGWLTGFVWRKCKIRKDG